MTAHWESKKLTAPQREKLDVEIRKRAIGYAIGLADVDEIDTINILRAARGPSERRGTQRNTFRLQLVRRGGRVR